MHLCPHYLKVDDLTEITDTYLCMALGQRYDVREDEKEATNDR